MRSYARSMLILAAAVAAAPLDGSAQSAQRTLSALAGTSFSGAGTSVANPLVAVRLGLHTAGALVIEPGLTYLSYEPTFRPRAHHLLSEVQIQAQRQGETFRPYVGVGFGTWWGTRSRGDGSRLTYSAAGGVRVAAAQDWTLRAELRVRTNAPWMGASADWSLGVGRAF